MEFFRYLKEGGRGIVPILLLLVGVILLLFAGKGKAQEKTDDRLPDRQLQREMERELEGMLCSMQGIEQAKVSLTLEGGNEYVWDQGKNITVLAGRVRGVAVVCTGGNDPVIRERVISLVCALLDLPMRAVSVCQ